MANIFYLMGAYGCQKEEVITELCTRSRCGSLIIAPRYRAPLSYRPNHYDINMTLCELRHHITSQHVVFSWHANGQLYGLGREIEEWLAIGKSVLVKGSRENLIKAQLYFGKQLIPILLHADDHILRQQMLCDGMTSSSEIEVRLIRARAYADSLSSHCHLVVMERDILKTTDTLLALLHSYSAV